MTSLDDPTPSSTSLVAALASDAADMAMSAGLRV
jgi:hypothetical protein